MKVLLASVIVVAISAITCQSAEEIEFEVHNLSNDPVFVAQAFNQGERISGGWTEIKPAEEKSFKAEWQSGFCLRVEKNGREITFQDHDRFLNFPATQERYTVSHSDNPEIDTFRWGLNLEKVRNIKRNTPLPDGWGVVRFFGAKRSGKHHLEILP